LKSPLAFQKEKVKESSRSQIVLQKISLMALKERKFKEQEEMPPASI